MSMLRTKGKQLSIGCVAYDKIPDDHMLKIIAQAVDFSFINDLLASSYCRDKGRPAKEPELMAKLLFLKYLYNLSDVRVIEEATFNLVWLWFLGLNPEDVLPEPSLLTKFRTERLKECSLDDIITEIVRQCVDQGLVKGNGVSIDATHMHANTRKLLPERIMEHLAKKIFSSLEEEHGEVPQGIDSSIPNWCVIDDHKVAKSTMKQYLETVIAQAEPVAGEETKAVIAEAKDILADELFLVQKGLRSLVDQDARVGRKSKEESFFGYKDEFIMTTDERIIVATTVHSGEQVDGKKFDLLMDRALQSGIRPTEVFGDKAYFKRDILDRIEAENAQAYIPVNPITYRVDEARFAYNKDSDQWSCSRGNETGQGKRKCRKNGDPFLLYTFGTNQCVDCPDRAACFGTSKRRARVLQVSLNTGDNYLISQKQKTDEFKTHYKKRAAHEWKNGEMKQFHGLARAKGYGLSSVTTQAKLTAIAVNLKPIASLVIQKVTVSIALLRVRCGLPLLAR